MKGISGNTVKSLGITRKIEASLENQRTNTNIVSLIKAGNCDTRKTLDDYELSDVPVNSSEMYIFPRSGDDHYRGSYDFKYGQIPNKTVKTLPTFRANITDSMIELPDCWIYNESSKFDYPF